MAVTAVDVLPLLLIFGVLFALAFVIGLTRRTTPTPIAPAPVRGRARALNREHEDENEDEVEGEGEVNGRRAARRAEKRAARRAARAAREADIEAYHERLALSDAARQAEAESEAAAAAASAAALAEKERAEQEEYERWRPLLSVAAQSNDGEGNGEGGGKEEKQMLGRFIRTVERRKVVVLEELAADFGLCTEDVVKRIKELELPGFFDDRGKFVHVRHDEMVVIAKWIEDNGRVSITQVAEHAARVLGLADIAKRERDDEEEDSEEDEDSEEEEEEMRIGDSTLVSSRG